MINRYLFDRIRWIFIALFLIAATCLVTPIYADVYVWKDVDNIQHVSNLKPEWWTEEMDLQEPGTVTAPETASNPGKFIGDRENKKFHWPKCEQIYNPEGKLAIPPGKQIWFQEYQSAVDEGYHVCDHCKPSADGPAYEPAEP